MLLLNLYFEILFMLRPRLIETIKFCGCRDRDSSRLGISVVVETETSRDWTKVVETETSSRVSLISATSDRVKTKHMFFILIITHFDLFLSFILHPPVIGTKQNNQQQAWVAFMSQPYWVEVKVEVEIEVDLRLRLKWGWDEVESKFS